MPEPDSGYRGLLVIGDPHLEGRQPGFRKDDFPRVILGKLRWCIEYALGERLLPILLGDLFDKPRDNPTWMLGELIDLLSRIECIGVYGNHDCADPLLGPHDSLSLLIKAGCVTLVDHDLPWRGVMNGRDVVIGGSSYRQRIPESFKVAGADGPSPLGVWITHHDLNLPGYDENRFPKPRPIPGVDLIINGHIHRRLDPVTAGSTVWMTPGNITRRSRSDAVRAHTPSVLRVDVTRSGYETTYVEVPHERFDDVFHEAVAGDAADPTDSAFVSGLAELQSLKTQSGAGLLSFLEQNTGSFDPAVSAEIMSLAHGVLNDDQEQH